MRLHGEVCLVSPITLDTYIPFARRVLLLMDNTTSLGVPAGKGQRKTSIDTSQSQGT